MKCTRLAPLLAATLILGCGEKAKGPLPPLSPTSSQVVYAQGWNQILIQANGAKTQVTRSAHYSTDRNLCQLPGMGAFDLALWNRLASFMNKTASQPISTTPLCKEPEGTYRFGTPGLAEIEIQPNEKRTLLELKEGKLCSNFLQPEKIQEALELIEQIIALADLADASSCPNYRP